MINLPELRTAIESRQATELRALANSPTSQSLIGILATRAHMQVERQIHEAEFDVYLCRDEQKTRVTLPSPFAVMVFPDEVALTEREVYRVIDDLLTHWDTAKRPILAISPNGLGELGRLLSDSNFTLVNLDCGDFVEILLAKPPRDTLVRRVLQVSSLHLLNPYIYKGPIKKNLFTGRQKELDLLVQLKQSYALIGPRTIGKTSLINRAYEIMREQGDVVIRAEFSESMSEHDLLVQFATEAIDEYEFWPGYRLNPSLERIQWILERAANRSPHRRTAIFIDEADGIELRCPRLVAMLKTLHNHGKVRFVLVGYKQLRRLTYDSKKSDLMNVLTFLPLNRMDHKECTEMVMKPMLELGIDFDNLHGVVGAIFKSSGGAPSRIQLYCHALVQQLSETGTRGLNVGAVEKVESIKLVDHELATWFRESTSDIEKLIAGLSAFVLPALQEQLISRVQNAFPELTRSRVKAEIQDLVTADILDYVGQDRRLDFTFPFARQLARPASDADVAVTDMRRHYKRILERFDERDAQ